MQRVATCSFAHERDGPAQLRLEKGGQAIRIRRQAGVLCARALRPRVPDAHQQPGLRRLLGAADDQEGVEGHGPGYAHRQHERVRAVRQATRERHQHARIPERRLRRVVLTLHLAVTLAIDGVGEGAAGRHAMVEGLREQIHRASAKAQRRRVTDRGTRRLATPTVMGIAGDHRPRAGRHQPGVGFLDLRHNCISHQPSAFSYQLSAFAAGWRSA